MTKVAVAFGTGIGNTICLIPLLKTLSRKYKKPIDLLPWQDRNGRWQETKGAELIPVEYAKLRTSKFKDYDILMQPQNTWPYWRDIGLNEVDFYLSQVKGNIELIREIDINYDDSILTTKQKKKKRIVLINGCSQNETDRWYRKLWPFFPEMAEELKLLFPEVEICKVGLSYELDAVKCVDYTKSGFNLLQTAGVIKHSDLAICNDTALMHVADALKVPILALFGSTTVAKSGPVQSIFKIVRSPKVCTPCYGTKAWHACQTLDCMHFIKPGKVLFELLEFNRKHKILPPPQRTKKELYRL